MQQAHEQTKLQSSVIEEGAFGAISRPPTGGLQAGRYRGPQSGSTPWPPWLPLRDGGPLIVGGGTLGRGQISADLDGGGGNGGREGRK